MLPPTLPLQPNTSRWCELPCEGILLRITLRTVAPTGGLQLPAFCWRLLEGAAAVGAKLSVTRPRGWSLSCHLNVTSCVFDIMNVTTVQQNFTEIHTNRSRWPETNQREINLNYPLQVVILSRRYPTATKPPTAIQNSINKQLQTLSSLPSK